MVFGYPKCIFFSDFLSDHCVSESKLHTTATVANLQLLFQFSGHSREDFQKLNLFS